MKKTIAILLACMGVSAYLLAATKQPQPLGNVALPSYTVAQINALTSNTTGQIVFCSNCTTNGGTGTICVSTSAFAAGFVLSTGTLCQ